MYRQGDVLIIPVETLPGTLAPVAPEGGRVVLAHGEVTGHAHTIGEPDVALFRERYGSGVFMRVLGNAPVALTHDEHDTIMIPPGWYQVVRQREYSPEEIRDVED